MKMDVLLAAFVWLHVQEALQVIVERSKIKAMF